MDFINENYVWLIAIGVVLFMALIGFIAEKTDFGRKERVVKKNNKDNKKDEIIDSVPVFVAPIVSDPAKPSADVLNASSDIISDVAPVVLAEEVIAPVVNEEIGAEPAMLEPISEVSIFDAPVESVLAADPSNNSDQLTEEVSNVELTTADPTLEPITEEVVSVEPMVDEVVEPMIEESIIDETVATEPMVEETPIVSEALEMIDLSPNVVEEPFVENVSELDASLPEIDSLANDNNDIEENIWKI